MKEHPCTGLLNNRMDCLLLQRRCDDLALKQKYTPESFTYHDEKKLNKCTKKAAHCENAHSLLHACMAEHGLK